MGFRINIFISLVFLLLMNLPGKAQLQWQDKAYKINEQWLVPGLQNGKVALLHKDQLTADSLYRIPVFIGPTVGNKLKYCIVKNHLITTSLLDRNGRIEAGPYLLAIDLNKLDRLSSPKVQDFLKGYQRTYHRLNDVLLADVRPFRDALVGNKLQSLTFDLAEKNDEEFFLLLAVKDSLKVWSYEIPPRGFPFVTDSLEVLENPDNRLQTSLLFQHPLDLSGGFSAFYRAGKFWVLTSAGDTYVLDENGVEKKAFRSGSNVIYMVDKIENSLFVLPRDQLVPGTKPSGLIRQKGRLLELK